jgi:hypothetical protein
MGQWQMYRSAITKHHQTKHDEPKAKTYETKLTNIREPRQANAQCLDRQTENGTCFAKWIS